MGLIGYLTLAQLLRTETQLQTDTTRRLGPVTFEEAVFSALRSVMVRG